MFSHYERVLQYFIELNGILSYISLNEQVNIQFLVNRLWNRGVFQSMSDMAFYHQIT